MHTKKDDINIADKVCVAGGSLAQNYMKTEEKTAIFTDRLTCVRLYGCPVFVYRSRGL